LTATVKQSGQLFKGPGTVNFCAVEATDCTGAAFIGSAQVSTTAGATLGTAVLDAYLAGEASNWFRAEFLGTPSALPSNSLSTQWPQTAAKYPTTSTMPTPTGSAGDWTLSTVVTSRGGKSPFAQGNVDFLDQTNKLCAPAVWARVRSRV
jgi:hypothetical protein